jgi:predicted neutral ceramidase superfamily lipid hydrolase
MYFGRPGSHIAAILYFLVVSLGLAFTGYKLYQAGDSHYIGEFSLALLHVIALASLATRSRWSYYLCAVLVFALAAFILFSLLIILLKVRNATFASLVPSFVGAALLMFLFYRFSFGEPSRTFYGFSKRTITGAA